MRCHRLGVPVYLGGLLLLSTALGWCDGVPRAFIIRVEGTVRVQRGGEGAWVTVPRSTEFPLYSGDFVQTYQR